MHMLLYNENFQEIDSNALKAELKNELEIETPTEEEIEEGTKEETKEIHRHGTAMDSRPRQSRQCCYRQGGN